MTSKCKSDSYMPLTLLLNSTLKSPSPNHTAYSSIQKNTKNINNNYNNNNININTNAAANAYPRTVRLSIPEMQEKAGLNDYSKNNGSHTYKEPRKEQSPDVSAINSGKILANKARCINIANEIERHRSKSPFENTFNCYKNNNNEGIGYIMSKNNNVVNNENFFYSKDEKLPVKEILKNNFFKETQKTHNKSQSVHQITYEVKNLMNKSQNQLNLTQNTLKLLAKFNNEHCKKINLVPEADEKQEFNDPHLNKFKENIDETPFASLNNKEKRGLNERRLVNEVPIASFINHLNIKNINSNKNGNLNNNIPPEIIEEKREIVNKPSFDFKYVIGKGGFGKVWKVERKKNRTLYAMKEMSKSKIITKRSVNSVMNERELLSIIEHPFIVNMVNAFQDRENLYLVMDLMTGGDLRYHIGRQRRFSEVQTKFFVACILLGLEYLHEKNIIHRDIKPENLVLDKNGYVRITDMGIARFLKAENSCDTSGTPGYMAPEVMCRQNHTFAVDYFAVGVIAYEFMLGRRPYLGRSRKEIRDAILAKQEQIKRNDIPDGWSIEAADFINKMLQRKPTNRLGINGAREVKQHPWFKNFPWDKLTKKELNAPFKPNPRGDNFDHKQQISIDGETNEDLIQQNALLLKRSSVQKLFVGYDYEGTILPLKKDEENTRSRSSSIAGAKTTINSTSSGSLF